METKKTYLYCYLLMCISFISLGQNLTNKNNLIQLISSKTQSEAGSSLVLHFSSLSKKIPLLHCSNAYGSTLVKSTSASKTRLSYTIPKYMSTKSGILNWKLAIPHNTIQGQVEILPKMKVHSMETYLGNPSILAGGLNYTSLVVIPTDTLDNPLKAGTPVLIKHQFLTNETKTETTTNNYIAFKKIYSPNKAGRMLISSESFGTNSKEYTADILPGIPTNFTITAKRNHDYADGNQITSIATSIVKDQHGNRVSDGTYVHFFIRTKDQAVLKTSASTIYGIANAQIIHPEKEAHWSIKAVVSGIAQSNTLAIKYKQVITDFDIKFSNTNNTLTVGPLQSFMGQMIPDGLPVHFTVMDMQKEIEALTKTSVDGFVYFKLAKEVYQNKKYRLEVRAAGITKKFKY